MSIVINPSICMSCGKCVSQCPGNLLEVSRNKAVRILNPSFCWGCAACIKVCPQGALKLFLPPVLGGRGARLSVKASKGTLAWQVELPGGKKINIDAPEGEDGY
ncbi:MAG: 4Fe-4S binding protein [Deltaproteobacteria bacterium]|jgi:adenylylsulfate reductase subunit B|nr:4Fe-4S binding protein [Deltaproteobacteria bacterium]